MVLDLCCFRCCYVGCGLLVVIIRLRGVVGGGCGVVGFVVGVGYNCGFDLLWLRLVLF